MKHPAKITRVDIHVVRYDMDGIRHYPLGSDPACCFFRHGVTDGQQHKSFLSHPTGDLDPRPMGIVFGFDWDTGTVTSQPSPEIQDGEYYVSVFQPTRMTVSCFTAISEANPTHL